MVEVSGHAEAGGSGLTWRDRLLAGDLRLQVARPIAIAMSLFHLYTAYFGLFDAILQRSIHLTFCLVLVILVYPGPLLGRHAMGRIGGAAFRIAVAICALVPLFYIILNYQYLTDGRIQYVSDLTSYEMAFGVMFILALLELSTRVTGLALPLVCVVFLAYPFIPNLPGVLNHGGYTLAESVEFQYLTFSGIFGSPLAASANFIVLFIIFGAFLEQCGLGGFLMNFTIGVFGRLRGGPAKVAVMSSAIMGTISGSATANVLTVGTITIPLMKKSGYPAFLAGAIEAAASTGGALMPPVMGTVAFIMSEFTGVPYGTIALYALIPAVLYYLGIYCTVHFAALHYDVRSVPEAELPDWRGEFRQKWHLLLPIALLVVLLSMDYSPQFAVGYSILSVLVVAAFRRGTRLSGRAILKALETGALGAIVVTVATACAGIIVGVFDMTTVGVKLAQQGNALAGTLFVGLVITAMVSLILGMGVPPSVAYLAQIAVTIPMLISFLKQQGLDPHTSLLCAHFFVMYYSTLAVITPPDALAAMAAAGVAQSPFLKTAAHATRVAFVAFAVPFMFVYRPALLTLGSFPDMIWDSFVAVCGIIVLAAALEGFCRRRLTWFERLLALSAGVCLLVPERQLDVLGLMLCGAFALTQYWPMLRARFSQA